MERKAAVMREFGKVQIQTFPYPKVAEDSMIGNLRMAGICGTDLHFFSGAEPSFPMPMILGHENLVDVAEIGAKARVTMEVTGKTLSPGDRVLFYPGFSCGECWYCRHLPQERFGPLCANGAAYGITLTCDKPPHFFGGFAECVYLLPKTQVYKVPDDLPDEVAVLTDIFASGSGVLKAMMPYPALNEGFRPTGIAVVQGSGPIGIACGIILWLCGAYKIILVGGPKPRLDLADNLGVFDEIINIDEVPDAQERAARVIEMTPRNIGADLVVDCTGVANAVPEGLDMVRRGGVYLETSSFVNTGTTTLNPFKHLCSKDVYLLGHYGSPPVSYEIALRFIELAWRKHHIPLDKIVTHKFPLARTEEALIHQQQKKGMKAVITP
jgi:L-iditol 2-dehydrogenase